jgi:hypothetical protein
MDYAEVLQVLSSRGARFAVAGGFACLAHGVVRVTLDLDLLVEVSDDNLTRLWEALSDLGFATQQPIAKVDAVSAKTLTRLARDKGMQALSWVHGTHPFVIVDLLVGDGFRWSAALIEEVQLFGLKVPVLRREELIRLKRAAGREKDLVDVRELERL